MDMNARVGLREMDFFFLLTTTVLCHTGRSWDTQLKRTVNSLVLSRNIELLTWDFFTATRENQVFDTKAAQLWFWHPNNITYVTYVHLVQ